MQFLRCFDIYKLANDLKSADLSASDNFSSDISLTPISDCCANKLEFKDEITKKRVRDAHAVVKDENIVQIKAVPDGKRAEANEGKTLTFALTAILEWEGRGVPLRRLEDELREEQRKQGSKNVPMIEVSDEFANEPFPL